MKAVVQTGYGADDVLQLQEVERPTAGDDEVLVRVRAASVHADVWHVMRGVPYVLRLMGAGLLKPKNRIPGTDMAGEVVAVGKDVKAFQPGDEVFGETIRGHQWQNGGAFAEYVAVREKALARKPANVTFEGAAAVPTSGLVALENMRGWGIGPGHRVLINGAGGAVGTIALQIAKSYGAEVTAVDRGSKLDMLRALGADHVIDYTREDFTQRGERYDLLYDVVGTRRLADCRRALEPKGTYVLIGHDHYGAVGRRWLGSIPTFLKLVMLHPFVSQRLGLGREKQTEPAIAVLARLLESGELTPHVGQTFPLSEIRAAIRALEGGAVNGKIVVTVG